MKFSGSIATTLLLFGGAVSALPSQQENCERRREQVKLEDEAKEYAFTPIRKSYLKTKEEPNERQLQQPTPPPNVNNDDDDGGDDDGDDRYFYGYGDYYEYDDYYHYPNSMEEVIIDNGVIMLGINGAGQLNVQGGVPDGHEGITTVGLRYFRDGQWYDGTSYGCECEGFGVGAYIIDLDTPVWGGANEYLNRHKNVEHLDAIVMLGPDSVRTTAFIGHYDSPLMIQHTFSPAPETPNLYKVQVNITNRDEQYSLTNITYLRAMDWDIPPTLYQECVSIFYGMKPRDLWYTTDDGFAGINPFLDRSQTYYDISCPNVTSQCPAYESGPEDHGALFNFKFMDEDELLILGPQESLIFDSYYGAASTRAEADDVISKVDLEIVSYGYPNENGSCDHDGSPNVFIYGFGKVGGTSLNIGQRFRIMSEYTGSPKLCAQIVKVLSNNEPKIGSSLKLKRCNKNPDRQHFFNDRFGHIHTDLAPHICLQRIGDDLKLQPCSTAPDENQMFAHDKFSMDLLLRVPGGSESQVLTVKDYADPEQNEKLGIHPKDLSLTNMAQTWKIKYI